MIKLCILSGNYYKLLSVGMFISHHDSTQRSQVALKSRDHNDQRPHPTMHHQTSPARAAVVFTVCAVTSSC